MCFHYFMEKHLRIVVLNAFKGRRSNQLIFLTYKHDKFIRAKMIQFFYLLVVIVTFTFNYDVYLIRKHMLLQV